MRIMPANNTSGLVHWLAGKAPESIGLLYTPARKESPRSWLPYALDNGAFAAAVNEKPFDWKAWEVAVEFFCHHEQPPLWLVVPDIPFDGQGTLRQWNELANGHRQFGVPLALAVQDGMEAHDVEQLTIIPDIIFIGGSTEWKWATVEMWCNRFPRVHVARVNGRRGLDICAKHGAESCDGSGWFRGRLPQLIELTGFIADRYGLNPAECAAAAASSRYARDAQKVMQFEYLKEAV